MSPGQSIAHYKITAKLGEGGMGEVWRATDTKLGREVAIKVLPDSFAADPDRLARFTREAQVLASLNHPNIAAIYGVEERAIVMELVEGADLAGPVPVETVIHCAKQIAAALEAAHEKGIIHRDLKPANIKVTPDGTVKLLDFGLAKAAEEPPPASGSPTLSPTLSLAMTQAGMILGTAAYMSPEQARGKPVDKRADIWAFGVVLFELLTGRALFGGGETTSDAMAAVIIREPDWNLLPADTPPPIRRMLERCLRKDPKLRLRDIGEARIALDEPEAAQPADREAGPVPRRDWRGWITAAVLALALAAMASIHFRETPPQPTTVRFQVPPPEGATLTFPFMSLSPDGRKLAFVAGKGGGTGSLWVRMLDSLEARALPGTDGAMMSFWSPDSRFLAFWADGKLKKIEASGGPPQALCNVVTSAAVAGWWSAEGVIFFSNAAEGIFRLSQAGGDPVLVTRPDTARGESSYWYPQILPDGRRFLYLILFQEREKSGIYLASLDGKEKRRLVGARTSFRYLPPSANERSGHLLLLREDTLMAQPLDPRTLEFAGDAFPVAERVGTTRTSANFAASPAGALAWRSGVGGLTKLLTWFDRAGKPLSTLGAPADYNALTLSKDTTRAALMQVDPQTGNRDIWLVDVAKGIPTRFTFDEAEEWDPVWSPDGSRVAFSSTRDGPMTLYLKDSSGAAKEERLQRTESAERSCDWSPDGRFLMYVRISSGVQKLWVLSDPAGDPEKRRATPYLDTPFNTSECQFSPGPEGAPRWVAYASDESRHGREIYVQSFPAGAGKFLISNGGGSQPRWRRDGKELFYVAPDGKMMAVDVKTGPRFETGIPRALFDSQMFTPNTAIVFQYDVTPDGQRFLVTTARRAEDAGARETITVLTNWMAGLKK